jgi:ribose transport system substrate-binding protein
MLSGPPVSVTTQRNDGFMSAIEGTNIEVVGKQDGGYQREKGYQVMQNALTANPEIDAVFSIDDEMSLGALQAIKEAGRTDIKYLTGAGGQKDFFEAIMNEERRTFEGHTIELASFMYQPDMIKDAIEVTMQIVNGNPPDWYEEGENVTQVIPAARVDAGNVEEYYDEDAPY